MLSRTSTAAFSMLAMFHLATCAFVDSPNDPIPDQWKQSLPMIMVDFRSITTGLLTRSWMGTGDESEEEAET
ncbi:hypothetical protein FMEXI_12558 [Fusarium mexicanum]|uniref:Secreted protein n=1 Tax=Fusarium mexicanum TaxID=751941 RepID=A0A8H5ID60_9HYPO|nr:hypothetical protein FMEXI_12558 [Fusarium mexicanum]